MINKKSNPMVNPFQTSTPEDMTTENTVSLFVDVFTDFPKLLSPGHTFLHGPRGSGKSMMFRYLMPDCQCHADNCSIEKLNFFSIYIPLKKCNFVSELKRVENVHGSDIISSTLLTLHCTINVFSQLTDTLKTLENTPELIKETTDFYNDCFIKRLQQSMWGKDIDGIITDNTSVSAIFKTARDKCREIYEILNQYIKRYAINPKSIDYQGAICDYLDFLFPILEGIMKLSFMPANAPIYLLVDDADNLSESMTQILNNWVYTRTSQQVSLKISTQLDYKTYYTTVGHRIETPHDYYEVNISTTYTSNKSKYRERLEAIVQRRLKLAGIDVLPKDFFPEYKKQTDKIATISERIRKEYEEGKWNAACVNDAITRYSRPEYIKEQAGTKKSSSSYSYAGFEQLTHLSSGIIRFFLESAFSMYSEAISKEPSKPVNSIPVGIQNKVVRQEANTFLFDNLDDQANDCHENSASPEQGQQLMNLLQAMGGMFRACLLSDRSERRVFSIALSDTPSEKIKEILKLGVKLGYLHEATIGKKNALFGGRTRLYILSRRLAPIWTLDPSGFAGYLFLQNDLIEAAFHSSDAMLKRVIKDDVLSEDIQLVQPTFDF